MSGVYRNLLPFVLLLAGLWFTGYSTWNHAKTILAQTLLETAWAAASSRSTEVKPGPGMEALPICRLSVPRLGISRLVLAGGQGKPLAFGPGHLFVRTPDSASPALHAQSLASQFQFLQELMPGDAIEIELAHQTKARYRVRQIARDEAESASYFVYAERDTAKTFSL